MGQTEAESAEVAGPGEGGDHSFASGRTAGVGLLDEAVKKFVDVLLFLLGHSFSFGLALGLLLWHRSFALIVQLNRGSLTADLVEIQIASWDVLVAVDTSDCNIFFLCFLLGRIRIRRAAAAAPNIHGFPMNLRTGLAAINKFLSLLPDNDSSLRTFAHTLMDQL